MAPIRKCGQAISKDCKNLTVKLFFGQGSICNCNLLAHIIANDLLKLYCRLDGQILYPVSYPDKWRPPDILQGKHRF